MSVSSLAIAAIQLKMVESVISAIDAVAPGLGGNHIERGVDRFEPRTVIHPDPRYLPRKVMHPVARYMPRPVLHPTARVEANNAPDPCVKQPETPSIPSPFPPVWKLLPAAHAHSAAKILKIAGPRIDIVNKGTLIDLFI